MAIWRWQAAAVLSGAESADAVRARTVVIVVSAGGCLGQLCIECGLWRVQDSKGMAEC